VAEWATAWRPIPLQPLKKFAVPVDSCYFSFSAQNNGSKIDISLNTSAVRDEAGNILHSRSGGIYPKKSALKPNSSSPKR